MHYFYLPIKAPKHEKFTPPPTKMFLVKTLTGNCILLTQSALFKSLTKFMLLWLQLKMDKKKKLL